MSKLSLVPTDDLKLFKIEGGQYELREEIKTLFEVAARTADRAVFGGSFPKSGQRHTLRIPGAVIDMWLEVSPEPERDS